MVTPIVVVRQSMIQNKTENDVVIINYCLRRFWETDLTKARHSGEIMWYLICNLSQQCTKYLQYFAVRNISNISGLTEK